MLSVVIPCYNEQDALPVFYNEILPVLLEISPEYEIILVDDGSKDQTLFKMRELSKKDSRVRYISFSRNFGKEGAIWAGLLAAKGKYVTIMDADLQDPPSLLPEMLQTLEKGEYDCVATRRVTRKGEPPVRSFFARRFYKLINRMSNTEVVDGARDFRMMTRKMTNAVLRLTEYNRFSKGIFGWVGFQTKWLEYENLPRCAGRTKFSFKNLTLYALSGIEAFSITPLRISSIFGIFLSIFALLFTGVIILRRVFFGDDVQGWASLMCVLLFLGGVQFLIMGIIGEYLANMYLEVKKRPIFIVGDTNIEGFDEKTCQK